MNAKLNLHGIIPAMITPFNAEGNICKPTTRILVNHLIKQGATGLYICGSTGEGFLLSTDERKYLLEIVTEAVSGRVPVIAHVGVMDTRTAIDLAKHAESSGASAISSVAPFYYKHRLNEVSNYYIEITEATDIPLIIYHFPSNTGFEGSMEFYSKLSQDNSIIGIKYTSHDVYEMQRLIAACDKNFLVFNGSDEICASGLLLGCCGAIGSTYNIMLEMFVRLYQESIEGNLHEMRNIQFKVNQLISDLLNYDTIAFEREILRLQGINVGLPRKPIQQLTESQCTKIYNIACKYPFLHINTK